MWYYLEIVFNFIERYIHTFKFAFKKSILYVNVMQIVVQSFKTSINRVFLIDHLAHSNVTPFQI